MRFLIVSAVLAVSTPVYASDPLTDFFKGLEPRLDLARPVRSTTKRRYQNYVEGTFVKATWYGGGERLSSHTASGQRFIPGGLTAAHKSLSFGTRVRFTNPKNGRSVVAIINDRGPHRPGYSYDLSRGSARAIGFNSGAIIATIVN